MTSSSSPFFTSSPLLSPLSLLTVGQSGVVRNLTSEESLKKRLMEMGLVRGTPVEIVRFAPMGDPVDIHVRGYHLSLRLAEAATIEVELAE